MQKFFEFWIERLLWVWLPIYSLHRVIKDLLEEYEEKNGITR